MNNDQPKVNNLLSPANVNSILNSNAVHWLSVNAVLKSHFSELAKDYKWQSKDKIDGKAPQIRGDQPLPAVPPGASPGWQGQQVPSAIVGPIPEHPSAVKIVEQGGTAAKKHEPEVPLEVETTMLDGATKQTNGGYLCDYCSWFMDHKGNMRSHIRTHTGEKLFQCSPCGKSFSLKSILKRHLRSNMHKRFKQINLRFIANK